MLPFARNWTYFGGPDGSVQLDASQGDTRDQVCRGAASHHLKPFGAHPRIKSLKVQGQEARLVWPSDDQGAPFYAEVVVQFPRPVEINSDRYSQLTVNPDKKHILDIIKTLRVQPKH